MEVMSKQGQDNAKPEDGVFGVRRCSDVVVADAAVLTTDEERAKDPDHHEHTMMTNLLVTTALCCFVAFLLLATTPACDAIAFQPRYDGCAQSAAVVCRSSPGLFGVVVPRGGG